MIREKILNFLREDSFDENYTYFQNLPKKKIHCELKFKDNLVISGLPFFIEVFNVLNDSNLDLEKLLRNEGRSCSIEEKFQLEFDLPFNIAISGERLALNLLQRSSSITTMASKFVKVASEKNIKILDTRKTTPGLRFLEKYAITQAGAYNHRMSQVDCFMIKDNHKKCFGSLQNAIDFFKSVKSFYNPLIVEIHSLSELEVAFQNNVKHVMLDNFSPDEITEAINIKPSDVTYEVSGGIRLNNIESYLVQGIDAISVGSLTYDAKAVDISLKMHS